MVSGRLIQEIRLWYPWPMIKYMLILTAILTIGCPGTRTPAPESKPAAELEPLPLPAAEAKSAPVKSDPASRAAILQRLEALAASESRLAGLSAASLEDNRLLFERGRYRGPNPDYDKEKAAHDKEILRRQQEDKAGGPRAKRIYWPPPEKIVELFKPDGIYLELAFYDTPAATPEAFIEAGWGEYRKEIRACANCQPRAIKEHAALGLYDLEGVLHGKVGGAGFKLVMRGAEGWPAVREKVLAALTELVK